MTARLSELRLDAFKSVREARLPLGPLTLLVGRNGSGKSNVLDALAVLTSLATGQELRDALDGGRDGPIVRGGSEGCAPLGSSSFKLGCSAIIDGKAHHLDLEVGVSPTVQILSERLSTGVRSDRPLLETDEPIAGSGDIVARWNNRKQGPNPPVTFRATQLLTSQVASRIPATTQAGREVHDAAARMLAALSSIFILDPVPHQMREYVSSNDTRLRRSADNLSAVLGRLLQAPSTRDALLSMTRSLSEAQVNELMSVRSDLGDVMVAISEHFGQFEAQVPARLMSDGTLRFLAIAAALLDEPDAHALQSTDERTARQRLLVVEEIENGLHPSQASLLLDRFRQAPQFNSVRTLATTHSPAVLDALSGKEHRNVFVCSRRPNGWSQVTCLTDFPDYINVVGGRSLGNAAVDDRLRPAANKAASQRALAEVLGL